MSRQPVASAFDALNNLQADIGNLKYLLMAVAGTLNDISDPSEQINCATALSIIARDMCEQIDKQIEVDFEVVQTAKMVVVS